jgi:hypothetical protein
VAARAGSEFTGAPIVERIDDMIEARVKESGKDAVAGSQDDGRDRGFHFFFRWSPQLKKKAIPHIFAMDFAPATPPVPPRPKSAPGAPRKRTGSLRRLRRRMLFAEPAGEMSDLEL